MFLLSPTWLRFSSHRLHAAFSCSLPADLLRTASMAPHQKKVSAAAAQEAKRDFDETFPPRAGNTYQNKLATSSNSNALLNPNAGAPTGARNRARAQSIMSLISGVSRESEGALRPDFAPYLTASGDPVVG